MTSVSSGYALYSGLANQIDPSGLAPKKASDDNSKTSLQDWEKVLESLQAAAANASNSPAYQDYATVQVNGKVIATIDNHGWVKPSNGVGNRIAQQLPGSVNGQDGPALAQARAEKIAELLGGKVVKSSSALTQSTFDNLAQGVSANGISGDGSAAPCTGTVCDKLKQAVQARAAFIAQQLGQDDTGTQDTSATDSDPIDAGSAAKKAFLAYMHKSPEERYFEAFLKEKGMTADDFNALPPKQQQALLQDFKDAMKNQMAKATAEKLAKAKLAGLL